MNWSTQKQVTNCLHFVVHRSTKWIRPTWNNAVFKCNARLLARGPQTAILPRV